MYEEERPTNGEKTVPEWTSTSGIDLWEPDSLYIQWLTFLFSIWNGVEYL